MLRSKRRVLGRDEAFHGFEPLEQRLSLAVVTWTGAGDGLSVMDPANWDHGHVPRAHDAAVIATMGETMPRLTTGTLSVRKLVVSGGLELAGGDLNVGQYGSYVHGRLVVSGGTFDGMGELRVSGRLDWTGGTITGSGQITVAAAGRLTIEAGGTVELRRDIYNAGRIDWNGGDIDWHGLTGGGGEGHGQGHIEHGNGNGYGHESHGNGYGYGHWENGHFSSTLIWNQPGATFKARGEGRLRLVSGEAAVLNEGMFVREWAGHSRFDVPFINAAVLNVAGGELRLYGGGFNGGPRHVAQGAVLHYYGDYAHGAGSTLAGGGETLWHGGTHWITGDWAMHSFLTLADATVAGPGLFTIDGVFRWSHGRMAGPGVTVIGSPGKLEVRTLGEHVLGRDLVNDGTLVWSRGPLTFVDATLTNSQGRNFFAGGETVGLAGGGEARIVNRGEMRKVMPTALDLSGVMLDNTGLLHVRNGLLTLGPVAQLQDSTLAAGAWTVFGLAQLVMPEPIRVIGAGAEVVRIGRLAGLEALSALERNQGRLLIFGGGSLDLDAPVFTNAGYLFLHEATRLNVEGFVQEATGVLDIGIASARRMASGRVISAQNAALGGTLEFTLLRGYNPQAGDRFDFLAAQTLEGQFISPVVGSVAGASLEYEVGGVSLVFA
jgi:hypothetical protein